MPAVTVSRAELLTLIGRPLSPENLSEALMMNKLEIDADGEQLHLTATPDRPDLFSVEGIARQLQGWLGIRTRLRPYHAAPPHVELTVGRSGLRPCVAAGVVRNIRLDDATIRSLFSLQESLDATLGRNRAKAAIGIHDLDQIVPPITYGDIPAQSRFVPLDMTQELTLEETLRQHPKGKAYAHLLSGTAYPAFRDQRGIISFAPIINSQRTSVTPETKNLFIEMQGSDQRTLEAMLNILVTALADRGGTIEAVKLLPDGRLLPVLEPGMWSVPVAQVNKTLGLDLKPADVVRLLERMNYDAVATKNIVEVLAPPYRADLMHIIDVVEDVVVGAGVQTLVPEMPKLPVVGSADPVEEYSNRARLLMVGLGFTETLNFSLTSEEKTQKSGLPLEHAVVVANPVSLDYTTLRQHLLPSLLENLAANTRRRYPQHLFEIADVVARDAAADTHTRNVRTLGGCLTYATADFSTAASVVRAVADQLAISLTIENADHLSFIPGRCGRILRDGKPAGFFGEVRPEVLENWGLKHPVAAFELRLD